MVPNTSTDVQFWTGPNTVLGDLHHTATGAAPHGQLVYIEMAVFIDNTVGWVRGYINGAQVFNITGIDTLNFWSTNDVPAVLNIHCVGTSCIDDVYVMDTSGAAPNNVTQAIGPAHVITMYPISDGGSIKGWTPSTGSNHANMVNENPVDYDTTYLKATTEGQSELFQFNNVQLPVDTLYAVQQRISLKRSTKSNSEIGFLTDGSERSRWGVPSENWYDLTDIHSTQPGGANWTIPAFNGKQFGMKHYTSRS
jgi:hypothetical protein